MKRYSQEVACDRIAEANCLLLRRKFEGLLGRPMARHQWLNIKQSMIEAGLDINDDSKLAIVAQIKAGGALTKTNATLVKQVMKWLMDLERFMMGFGDTARGWSTCRGVVIWTLQTEIIKDRIADGDLESSPADSTRYQWFHICCPNRARRYAKDVTDVNYKYGYSPNALYTKDEVYALIIKAATFVNKKKKPKDANPEAGATTALATVV